MGAIIGGAIGLAGSLIGGSKAKSAANAGAGLDLTGYNYLTKGAGAPTINAAQDAGINGSRNQSAIQGTEADLLGVGGDPTRAKSAFDNYLNSTGYQFQMDQGTRAIAGNAATRGLLGSGGTAKALTDYGQGMGKQYFGNYLGSLGNLNTQAANTAGQGITAVSNAGAAGTQGGMAAGHGVAAAGDTQATGIVGGASALAKTFSDSVPINNFLGKLF